jgi:hypothetical protein
MLVLVGRKVARFGKIRLKPRGRHFSKDETAGTQAPAFRYNAGETTGRLT